MPSPKSRRGAHRYDHTANVQVRHLLERAKRPDRHLMDLEPEIQLLRAMVIHYVESYEHLNTMLEEWHVARVEAYRDRGSKGAPPIPPRVLELHDARELIEAISRVVERTHKIRTTGAISLDTFQRLLESMGLVVARHVKDPEKLKAIETDWAALVVDSKTSRPVADADDEES